MFSYSIAIDGVSYSLSAPTREELLRLIKDLDLRRFGDDGDEPTVVKEDAPCA